MDFPIPEKPRILIVDDSRSMLLVTNAIISREFDTYTTTSAHEALSKIQQESFHILITDLVMEEMSGIDLIHQAKALDPMLICILVTGYSSKNTAISALKEGVHDYLEKPLDPEDTLITINKAWETLRTRLEARELNRLVREKEARLSAILNTAADGIITIREDGAIETVNRATEEMFGYTATELLGKSVSVLMPHDQQRIHEEAICKHLETGQTRMIGRRSEVVAVRSDGTEFPIEITVSAMEVDGGKTFTGIMRDISERKANETLLAQRTQQMQDELNLARDVQQSFLPRHNALGPLQISCLYLPLAEVSGDFYEFNQFHDEEVFQVFIGDATGHGTTAGFITMMMAMALQHLQNVETPCSVLTHLNAMLTRCTTIDKFMTCAILHVDQQGEATISTAGHPPVLWWSKRSGKIIRLQTEGMAVGILDPAPIAYQTMQILLETGDRLFLYTDGIIELENDKGEMYGLERLELLIQAHKNSAITEITIALKDELTAFTSHAKGSQDDMTLLALEFCPAS